MKLASAIVVLMKALAVAASSSASTGRSRLLGDAAHFRLTWEVRPASILYTGDSTAIVGGFDGTGIRHPGHLEWSSWTTGRATGSGAVWIDSCSPDCAHGTFSPDGAEVVAFRPVHGHFTRLTARYSYRGKNRVDRVGIRRTGRSWSYYVVGR